MKNVAPQMPISAGPSGLSFVRGKASSFVTWEQLADAHGRFDKVTIHWLIDGKVGVHLGDEREARWYTQSAFVELLLGLTATPD